MEPFARRLKAALAGDPDATFVHIGNFDVERQWAVGEVGLPAASWGSADASVARLDELALGLAGAGDYVVVKAPPDPGFLDYLRSVGLGRCTVVAAARSTQPAGTVTEEVLADPAALAALSVVAGNGGYLLAHGVSAAEEQLADRCGLKLATSPSAVAKAVNSKVYSRRLAADLGLRQPVGWACENLDDLAEAVRGARPMVADGRRVVFKDAFGVSGRGLVLVDDEHRLDQVHRMVASLTRRRGQDRIALVVEEWVPKSTDLGYQLTIAADATVRFDFVREAVIAAGVHQGNRIPAPLDDAQTARVHESAQAIGARMAADGYRGVVGVDAMLAPDGGLYPVNEINARNTMSTYHAALVERFVGPGQHGLARHYPLKLASAWEFERLHDRLADLLLTRVGGEGLILNTFATVNAAATATAAPFAGRLYALVVAGSAGRLAALDGEIAARLPAGGGTGG
jgi:phosphoribosylaminoimidazole carboxylase (NCAIR synthetase)